VSASIAVSSGHAGVGRVVLSLGAHPDGLWMHPLFGTQRPLQVAMKKNFLPMVHALLEAGANPELVIGARNLRESGIHFRSDCMTASTNVIAKRSSSTITTPTR
jgi:hypothetical protein